MSKAEKTVRGSYSIPQVEREILDNLPNKFSKIKPKLNKSEIIRVGIKLFQQLEAVQAEKLIFEKLERLKVGKPKKDFNSISIQNSYEKMCVNDKQWKNLIRVFPKAKKNVGKPKTSERQILNGILYIFRFDKQRRDVPKELCSFITCRRKLKEWRSTGIWQNICAVLTKHASNIQEENELNRILLRTCIIRIKT